MKLEDLKGKTIDDAMLADLLAFAQDLTAQRDAARQESITGRRGKDAKIKEQADRIAAMADLLGIDIDSDLSDPSTLPNPRGQAEAVRQFEAKLKRAERERTEAQQQLAQLTERFDGQRRTLALKDALASQPFIDADDARVLIERGVQADGDGFVFQGADGKVMGLQDAAAWLAKTKPYMVAAPHAGSQGSGFKPGAQGAGGGGNSGNAPTLDVAAIYAARASKPAAA